MPKEIYKKKEEIVARKIAGEMLLVPIHGKLADMQQIFALTPVAEFIWKQLDGKKDLIEIRDNILASFNVQKEVAEADLRAFMTQLSGAKLIERTI
jgi:hypothetical protein